MFVIRLTWLIGVPIDYFLSQKYIPLGNLYWNLEYKMLSTHVGYIT